MKTLYVNLTNAKNNVTALKKTTGKKVLCVVKSDAYGHGLNVAKVFDENGADGFVVATAEEGVLLRRSGVKKDILITNCVSDKYLKEIVNFDLTLSAIGYDYILNFDKSARKLGVKLKCHIATDTGMHRFGFSVGDQDLYKFYDVLNCENLAITGLYTHLFNSNVKNDEYTFRQIKDFYRIKNAFKDKISLFHASNSFATLNYPMIKEDAVRCGLSLYGGVDDENYKSLFTFKTKICSVKKLRKGETLGYGGKTFDRDIISAVIPVGYADGFFPRKAYDVTINGKNVPVIANVCMNHTFLDVTGACVETGDEVVLLKTKNDLLRLSKAQNTTIYQTMCILGGMNKRFIKYVNEQP